MSKYGTLKKGVVRDDGFTFSHYTPRKNGSAYENWVSPEDRHNRRMEDACKAAKSRAVRKQIPFNIDTEHLKDLYPKDGLCPALKIPLEWGGDRNTSPALDRIVPALGYVRGNVQFLSGLANRIKTNATTDQIISVANFLKELHYS